MSLKGNVNDLRKLQKRIKAFPIAAAEEVSRKAAPAFTQLTNQAFNSRQTVYGEARPEGVNGNPLTLVGTGPGMRTKDTLRFVQIGTIVRCVLGTDHAKYLIGKYRILPMGEMPSKWSNKLREFVAALTVNLQ